jgi:hypothetical protein
MRRSEEDGATPPQPRHGRRTVHSEGTACDLILPHLRGLGALIKTGKPLD